MRAVYWTCIAVQAALFGLAAVWIICQSVDMATKIFGVVSCYGLSAMVTLLITWLFERRHAHAGSRHKGEHEERGREHH